MRTYSVPLDPAQRPVVAAWTLDPWTTAVVAALLGGVLLGARRAPHWSRARLVPLVAGLAFAVVAVDAWPGVYARSLLSVLVSQQLTLLLVAPVLIAFGRPAEPLRALGLRLPPAVAAAHRRLGHPLLGPVLVPVVTALLYFSPLLDVALRSRLGADLLHVALLLVGAVVAAPLTRDDLDASSLGIGLVVFVGLIELLVDAIPGIVLRLMHGTLGPVMTLAAGRDWGPSARHDQQLGGAILWAAAELVDLPYLMIVLGQWIRADAREAVRVDAALDRAARPPAAATDACAVSVDPDRGQPWWEQDPSVFDERRARHLRRPQ